MSPKVRKQRDEILARNKRAKRANKRVKRASGKAQPDYYHGVMAITVAPF
jgi:hypothetical protein